MNDQRPWWEYFLAGFLAALLGAVIGLATAPDPSDCEPKTKTVYATQNATVTECK